MTVTVLERVDWRADGGATPQAGYPAPHAQFVGLAIHHTVMVLPDYDRDGHLRGDLDDVRLYMRTLQYARPDLGPDVPYSFVVFPGARDEDGIVAVGRGFGRTGAHTIDYNSTRYGVAYAGNASIDRVTPGVLEAVRWVGARLASPGTAAATFGHRDVKSTECPGNNLYALLDRVQPPFAAPAPLPDFRKDDPMIVKLKNPVEGKPALLVTGARAVTVPGGLVDDYRRAGVPVVELDGAEALTHYGNLNKLRS